MEPETIVLDEEGKTSYSLPNVTVPKPIKKKCKKKRRESNSSGSKRNVTLEIGSENMETLIITQKVTVKKRALQCIINLKQIHGDSGKHQDTKTKKKHKHRKKQHQCKPQKSSELKTGEDRIVPHCRRKRCWFDQITKIDNRKYKNKCVTKVKEQKHNNTKEKEYCSSSNKLVNKTLSAISLSSLNDPKEISYEDITSDSFLSSDEEDLNTLIRSAKEREKQMKGNFSDEEDLNMLIKRAKEREKHLKGSFSDEEDLNLLIKRAKERETQRKESFNWGPLRASTPNRDIIETKTLTDDSSPVDSQATFVLKTHSVYSLSSRSNYSDLSIYCSDNLYSPTHPTMSPRIKTEEPMKIPLWTPYQNSMSFCKKTPDNTAMVNNQSAPDNAAETENKVCPIKIEKCNENKSEPFTNVCSFQHIKIEPQWNGDSINLGICNNNCIKEEYDSGNIIRVDYQNVQVKKETIKSEDYEVTPIKLEKQ